MTLLMTVYAAGWRVSEVARLPLKAMESDPSRRRIRIHQGKGNKDRYSQPTHAQWQRPED